MNGKVVFISGIALIAMACSLPFLAASETLPTPIPPMPPTPTTSTVQSEDFAPPAATNTPTITHTDYPATSPGSGGSIYDVVSQDTANEKRAPYGDSYKINRLERPFKQDMTYISDLDIDTFSLGVDDKWIYISIELVGSNPNNDIGIRYGVEIDNDGDGFGDTIIWAEPPYSKDWTNNNVQVYEDSNHDTAGLSAGLSDAPIDTDGYDKLIFDRGIADDADLAWVRSHAGEKATIQFAFKKSLTDGSFMLGVLSDAGLRDVGKLDYVDRFLPEDAGSPVRDNKYYPLGGLYLVDNTCREAFGYTPTGFEPQLCPRPEKTPGELGEPTPASCVPITCAPGCYWMGEPQCECQCLY